MRLQRLLGQGLSIPRYIPETEPIVSVDSDGLVPLADHEMLPIRVTESEVADLQEVLPKPDAGRKLPRNSGSSILPAPNNFRKLSPLGDNLTEYF